LAIADSIALEAVHTESRASSLACSSLFQQTRRVFQMENLAPKAWMRKLLFVPLALVAGITVYLVWSSSPSVPLTVTRDQAIARAASDATVQGNLAWTRVESKLVTYGEARRLFLTPSLNFVDPTDPDALVWLVAYVGPMVSISADYCEWGVRAFRADARIGTDWSAKSCGKGHWPSDIDLFPDRSWFRLDDLRGPAARLIVVQGPLV
jgi:hypothetical protein